MNPWIQEASPHRRAGRGRSWLRAALLVGLVLGAARAQDGVAPTLSADLREEYLTGEPLLVRLEARNETGQPLTIPDLAARHDLVRFEMKFPDGQTHNRRSLVEEPPQRTWSLPPRAAREVLLELPASSTLKPGVYQLAIHVRLDEAVERTLPPRSVRLAAPDPVAADLRASAQVSERTGDLVPWVHKGTGGYDLYLFRADNDRPDVRLAQDHLARLPEPVTPSLTAARAGEPIGRYLVWQSGDRRLSYAALQDHRLASAPRSLDAPWPRIEIAAQGLTAPDGALHQPVWIPAPGQGSGGELRLASVPERGNPAWRRVGRYEARPEIIRSFIDDAGSVHLLVATGRAIDLFTVKADTDLAAAARENLPVAGRRIYEAPSDQPLVDARFAALDATADFPGGAALLLLERTAPGTLTPRWRTLGGQPIQDAPPLPLPDGARLIDISPSRDGQVGALMRLASGELRYLEGGRYQVITGITGSMALDRDRQGRPWLRALGRPLITRPLRPETPLPALP